MTWSCLPGDLSMARNHRDLQPDLAWLDRLPGTKVLAAGNHDAWWNGVEAIRPMLRRSHPGGGWGRHRHPRRHRGLRERWARRSWIEDVGPDAATLDRLGRSKELAALDAALSNAASKLADSTASRSTSSGITRRSTSTGGPAPASSGSRRPSVTACVYGHLHIQGQWSLAVQGEVRGVRYHCVAADAIGFRPLAARSADALVVRR